MISPGLTVPAEPAAASMTMRWIGQMPVGPAGSLLRLRRAPPRGRWLTAQDECTGAPIIAVGDAAARPWHLRPGSTVTLTTAGGPVGFTVIGVGGSNANNAYNIYTTLPPCRPPLAIPG